MNLSLVVFSPVLLWERLQHGHRSCPSCKLIMSHILVVRHSGHWGVKGLKGRNSLAQGRAEGR